MGQIRLGRSERLIQMGDAPACNICGSLMVRSGTCYPLHDLWKHKWVLVASSSCQQQHRRALGDKWR